MFRVFWGLEQVGRPEETQFGTLKQAEFLLPVSIVTRVLSYVGTKCHETHQTVEACVLIVGSVDRNGESLSIGAKDQRGKAQVCL